MRLKDIVIVTHDEQYNPASDITGLIENILRSVNMDTYNEQYVVHLTVDKVDKIECGEDDED